MANTQLLKRRIRSIGNTKQITKAMEMVAAAKLRRVQEAVIQSRQYADASLEVINRLSHNPEAATHPLFKPTADTAKLYIIFSSDRGLAGAFNSNVFNAAARAFAEDSGSSPKPQVIAFGRRGAHHFSRGSNIELVGDYENVADSPDINIFAPVVDSIMTGVNGEPFSSVVLVYTESVSTMLQQVRLSQLVPISPPTNDSDSIKIVYEFEPDAETVMESALRLYLESALRRARVEAAASEHAMRMISMGNANRNAGDLIDDLTLELNATRQATITQEMAEIIGGSAAISE